MIDPPASIVDAMAAVLEVNCWENKPLYGEVLEFPVSVTTPSVVQLSAVKAPSLTNRMGDPAEVTHECPNARATVVLQTPSVGETAPNPVSEKSRTPPASTINGLVLLPERSRIVPVPEVKVPPE